MSYDLQAGHLSCKSSMICSNSRSILKILYNLCWKALSEPIRAPFVAFDTPCTVSIQARRETPQLSVSPWVELRHGDGTRGQIYLEVRGSLTRIDRQDGS